MLLPRSDNRPLDTILISLRLIFTAGEDSQLSCSRDSGDRLTRIWRVIVSNHSLLSRRHYSQSSLQATPFAYLHPHQKTPTSPCPQTSRRSQGCFLLSTISLLVFSGFLAALTIEWSKISPFHCQVLIVPLQCQFLSAAMELGVRWHRRYGFLDICW